MDYQQQMSTIEVDANNISRESLDCGIRSLNWCTGARCQTYATMKNFIISLSAVALLQGAIECYFRISVKQAAINLNFDSTTLDWLLVSGPIMQAFIAPALAFWSQKYHPMTWLSSLVLFQSAFSFVAVIPTIDYLAQGNDTTTNSSELNTEFDGIHAEIIEPLHSTATLILLFVLNLILSSGSTAYYTIGLSYIDDNAKSIDSPAFLGVGICAYVLGFQLGTVISLFVSATTLGWWLGWIILSPLLFTCGILIALFPRKLIKTVVQQAADKIASRLSQNSLASQAIPYLDDFTFKESMKRLLTNRILIFNLVALCFIETVAANFYIHEQNYLQSRFFLPTSEANGLLDEWASRFATYLSRPLIMGICLLLSGLIISKVHPKGRTLALWNLGIGAVIFAIYIGYNFIDCPKNLVAGAHRGKIIQPYCSKGNICNSDVFFSPTCPQNGLLTYFSPCHAGCKSEFSVNNLHIYENCTCGTNIDEPITNGIATVGACNIDECQNKWILFQTLSILVACLLGVTKVSRMIITLRIVLPQDKALALALELTLTGISAYLLGKIGYDLIAQNNCQYWSPNNQICYLHETPKYSNYINICSAVLMFFSLIFDALVSLFSKELNCFTKTSNDLYVPLQARMDGNNNSNDENRSDMSQQEIQRTDPIDNDIQLITGSPRFFGRMTNDRNSTANSNDAGSSVYSEIVRPTKTIDSKEALNFHMRNSTMESETDQDDEPQIVLETKAVISSIPETETRKQRPQSPETDF